MRQNAPPPPAGWFGGEIPYPPLQAWRPLATAELRSAWSVDATESVGLYIQLPPMVSMRTDSPFERAQAGRGKKIDLYLDSLENEADMLGLPAGFPVQTVYIASSGLGVLSTFPEAQLGRLLGFVRERFDLKACRQLLAEIRPIGLTTGQARALSRHGVDRITMMIPDLAGRPESRERLAAGLAKTCRLCRRHGVASIDVDLVLGALPSSKPWFERTLATVLALKPDSVHVMPAFGDVSAGTAADQSRHLFLDEARERVRAALSRPAEARPPAENLQLASSRAHGGSVLGLGYGAVSHRFARVKYVKSGTYPDYLGCRDRRELPGMLGCLLDAESEMRAYLAGQFEDVGWLDLATFESVFKRELPPAFFRTLSRLLERGLCERRGRVVSVADRYRAKRFEIARLFHHPAS